MSGLPSLRPDLEALTGYHSPQVDVEVRLNTNESPFGPPPEWREEYAREVGRIDFHRYPDRDGAELREAIAKHHGIEPAEVFCANGSNEVLQSLLLAYGGPTREVLTFEPTYSLHRHIAGLTGTPVVSIQRAEDFTLAPEEVDAALRRCSPVITFLCSPNNPTGRVEPPGLVRHVLSRAPGLVVVDEAYGQFAHWSALDLRGAGAAPASTRRTPSGEPPIEEGARRRLGVVRTFSKTWALAAVRLGYLVADPEVVDACQQVALPYRLSTATQLAGLLALKHDAAMRERVAAVTEERGRVQAGLANLPVETWPSEANFILFRPLGRPAKRVWSDLLDRSVLVRDCSSWDGLDGCLRVTIGTPEENRRFLDALEACLR